MDFTFTVFRFGIWSQFVSRFRFHTCIPGNAFTICNDKISCSLHGTYQCTLNKKASINILLKTTPSNVFSGNIRHSTVLKCIESEITLQNVYYNKFILRIIKSMKVSQPQRSDQINISADTGYRVVSLSKS